MVAGVLLVVGMLDGFLGVRLLHDACSWSLEHKRRGPDGVSITSTTVDIDPGKRIQHQYFVEVLLVAHFPAFQRAMNGWEDFGPSMLSYACP
jgi:hypothetical protein